MDPSIEAVRPHVEMLCRRLGARRLDLLRFDDDGDVEILADLGDDRDDRHEVRAALERHLYGLFGRPVTVVEATGDTGDTGAGPQERREPLYRE